MATLPGDKVPKPRLRPATQQKPNLRNPADVPGPDVLGTAQGAENFYPRPRPSIDLGATGNTDFTPRLREDIPIDTVPPSNDLTAGPPPEIAAMEEAAQPKPAADPIRDQSLADARKSNPDVQFAQGTTGDMIFATKTRANERAIEADKITGFAARPDFRTPTAMASNDTVDATRAKLERLNGTRPDSWMYDAHIPARIAGTSDQPPTTDQHGSYEPYLADRYKGITNDQALDGLMRPKFDELAKVNPIAAANGSNVGDTWRTVQALGDLTSTLSSRGYSNVQSSVPLPAKQPQADNPDTIGLPWGKRYPDASSMVADMVGGVAGAANELLGIKPAMGAGVGGATLKNQPMTPDQAMQYLTGTNKAPPPPAKGPLDVMWQFAADTAKTAAANTVDAVAQVAPGAYSAVKSGLDAIDGISSGIAGFVGEKTGLQFLKDYAQGGLGIPEADQVFGPATTPAGALSRGISQFLVGYAIGGKALEGLGWAAGTGGAILQGGRTLTQGAVADGVFFNGQAGNLSDLIDQFPPLRNPVTDYLKSDPNDSEAEGRFKNALNGVIATPLVPAFVAAVRGVRAGVKMSGILENAAPTLDLKVNPVAGKPVVTLLGDAAADAPLSLPAEAVDPATGKLLIAANEVAAKGLTEIGGGPSGGPAVLANFAAIRTPDDIQKIANDLAAAYEGTTDAARRGVISNEQTKSAAGELDAFDSLMARKTGDAPNDAQVYAWKSLYMGSLQKLQEVARAASTAPIDQAPAALIQMREMEAVVLAVQKEFYGARAEAGRALQAFKIPPDSVFQQKQIETLLNAYGGIDANVDLARKIASVNDPAALADFIGQSAFTKAKDAWQQLFYFNVLSSPKTHIRNFVGNSVMLGLNMGETALAGGFSSLMGDDAVKAGEAVAQWYGIKAGFVDALQAAGRTWKTGEGTGGYGLNKVDFPQRNAISGDAWGLAQGGTFGRAVDALGAVTMVSNRALASSDEFFKTVGASATGWQLAYRQSMDRLSRGAITPDQVQDYMASVLQNFPNSLDSATKAAVADKAAYLTFTTPPKQGGWVDYFLKMRAIGDQPDASLGAKVGGVTARMILPFANTPANILMASFERTPLAPLTARYRDAMAAGGSEAYMANAKMAMGSMTMATWMDLAMNGTITGQGPNDSAQLQVMQAQGWQPYSIKVGDHYVSYQGVEPLSTVLAWSARLGEILSNTDMSSDPTAQANFEKDAAAALFAIGDVVLSKSYLSSSADFIDAINSGTPSTVENFVKKYGAGLLVPNAVRDVSSMVDPVQKYTTSIFDEAQNRIPGMGAGLPPRRDAFGFPKAYQSGFGAAYDAISPFYATQVKNLPIASAMLKDGWAISMPPMAFSIDSQRVDVTNQPQVYSRFLELRGQVKPSDLPDRLTPNFAAPDRYGSGEAAQGWSERLKDRYGDRTMVETLNGIVSEAPPTDLGDLAQRYHSFTNADDRRRFIQNIVGDYQDAAKAVLFSEYPQLPARAAQLKAAGQEVQP